MMRLRLKKESGRNEVIDSCNSRGINKPLACFSHVPPRRQSNVVTTLHHIGQLCFRDIVFCERLYCERATETPHRRPNSDRKHSERDIRCSEYHAHCVYDLSLVGGEEFLLRARSRDVRRKQYRESKVDQYDAAL